MALSIKHLQINFHFFHGDSAKPLATPWQVAVERAKKLITCELPEGLILDCACGSGVQLAAYASIARRPALGVELNETRANASAKNLKIVANFRKNLENRWFTESLFLSGDGRDGTACMQAYQEYSQGSEQNVALLILDPARPRNSRTHGLDEMAPRLPEIFDGWKPDLSEGVNGPAIILDLSP